jgi:SAM-dependent methyltransferase
MRVDEKNSVKFYDGFANEYHVSRIKGPARGRFFNEYLEMPATLKMLGNVKGKKILDYGCGSGLYAKILSKHGAIVKGFDISSEMIKFAKQENPSLDLRIGSGYKIPFKEKFDIILASLVFGYMSDWKILFGELSRVLKSNGFVVFSTNNPVVACKEKIKDGMIYLGKKDYFKEDALYDQWSTEKVELIVPWHHKTLGYIVRAITQSGFELVDYSDPRPLKSAKKYFPEYYALYSKVPRFSVWKVRKKLK